MANSAVNDVVLLGVQAIELAHTDPSAGHCGKGPGTPGCGTAHQLCIARLKHDPRGWMVVQRGHRRR